MTAGCPHDPLTAAGAPTGQYHCPMCGCMVVAGLAHPLCDPDECAYGDPLRWRLAEARGLALELRALMLEHNGTAPWVDLPYRYGERVALARKGVALARLVLEATGDEEAE